jgi:hypothetical protein
MIVTSLSALALSVRSTLTWGRSTPGTSAPAPAREKSAPARPTDTVELSKDRAETLIKALDADGDGVVTKEEFTDGARELLKRAAVRFHHLPPTKARGIEKRDDRWTGRLEDAFAHVDRNHDGAIDLSELTSALPKPVQRPAQRQSFSPTESATGSTAPAASTTTSVTVVAVAIRRYITGA